MSNVDDETDPTIPAPAIEVPAIEVGPIPAGKAQLAIALAFAAVSRALAELENAALTLEATATACARALDAGVGK
jgi:hypothetical protein